SWSSSRKISSHGRTGVEAAGGVPPWQHAVNEPAKPGAKAGTICRAIGAQRHQQGSPRMSSDQRPRRRLGAPALFHHFVTPVAFMVPPGVDLRPRRTDGNRPLGKVATDVAFRSLWTH